MWGFLNNTNQTLIGKISILHFLSLKLSYPKIPNSSSSTWSSSSSSLYNIPEIPSPFRQIPTSLLRSRRALILSHPINLHILTHDIYIKQMGLFRRIAGFLGIAKEEAAAEELKDEDENDAVSTSAVAAAAAAAAAAAQHHQRKGLRVPVQVAVDRPPAGPVLVPCSSGNGGVQGFRWYAKRLRVDEDGDVADEFLDEVLPEKCTTVEEHHKPLPRFQAKHGTRPAKVSNQARCLNGKIQFGVELQGRLEWV